MTRQIAIRLGTEGNAQVVADLDAIGVAGDASAQRLARSYVKASRDADSALEFAGRQATKLAALLPGLNPTKLDMAAGVRDGVGKAAETSAAVFEAAYSRMEQRAAALISAIDPTTAAQRRFDAGMSEAKALLDAGALSTERYAQVQRNLTDAIDEQRHAVAARAAAVSRAAGASLDQFAGVRSGPGKSAEESASVFSAAYAQMEQRAAALVAAIDPATAAQRRFDAGMAEAKALLDAGVLSAERYAHAQRNLAEALDDQRRAASARDAAVSRAAGASLEGFAGVQTAPGKSAAESASVFSAAYEQMEHRANALRAAIDPVFAAQQRFDREMAETRTLISAGAISLDDYVAKLRQEQTALDAVSGGHKVFSNSAGATRQAMQGLSYQLQDTFTQISMGTNVLQVAAIQGGQVAGQFSNLEGKAGNVARFFIGPWGLAITAAALVLGPFLGKILNTNSAIDDAIDKLKKDAKETENTRVAKERFARSAEGVAASIREQTHALDDAAKSERSAAERANILAKENLKREMAVRAVTAALLDQAIAQEKIDTTRAQAPGQRGELGTLALTESSGRVAGLQKQLDANQAAIDVASKNLNRTRIDLAEEGAKAIATAEGRINREYDRRIEKLKADADQQAKNGRVVGAATQSRIAAINAERAAALKAESDKQKAIGETSRQYGREVTSSQASAIARAAGLQVNSADRSTARQTQLYNAWVAQGRPKENPVAKPGTSAHERGNALDIQFQAGVTAKKIKDAFAAEGVRLTKVFAETGHWHVEWARTAEQRTAETDAAKATRDLAVANRELDSDLAEVVKQFDPARAAGEEYAATLAKIAALRGAGKITGAEAGDYTMAAIRQDQARVAEAQKATITTMFGGSDKVIDDAVSAYDRQSQAEVESWTQEYERRQQRQEEGVRTVAGYYRDLMTGNTASIFNSFKERGLQAISELLAKWTFGKGSGGEGLLGSIGKALGSILGGSKVAGSSLTTAPNIGETGSVASMGGSGIPKLASGTEYWSGGTALLGEHGPERAWLPAGTRVTPAGATRRDAGNDRAPQTITATFHQTYQFEGVALTQEQFAAGLNATQQDTMRRIADMNRRRA